MKIITPILSIFFFILSCTDEGPGTNPNVTLADSVLKERWAIIKQVKDSIREGDLVLRCGNDQMSESLSDFSQQEKLFSHSGVAIMDDGEMYVYSNMAGDINPDEIMRRDKVDSFVTPANNVAVGVYRFDLSPQELERLTSIVHTYYKEKLQFDMNFDLSSDDKMYCAEMIAKAIENATSGRIVFSKSLINNALKEKYLKKLLQRKIIPSAKAADQREYLALDNLYINPHCKEVIKVVFGKPNAPIKFPTPENYEH